MYIFLTLYYFFYIVLLYLFYLLNCFCLEREKTFFVDCFFQYLISNIVLCICYWIVEFHFLDKKRGFINIYTRYF